MPILFDTEKRRVLERADKSRKGSIDEPVQGLVKSINQSKDYYTTSSCSGRIMIIERKSKKKNESEWLLSSHDPIDSQVVWKILSEHKTRHPVWFIAEGLILHINCRDRVSADVLLTKARSIFKHSGIISTKHWTIEIRSSKRLEIPVHTTEKLLIKEEYCKKIVEEANKLLLGNFESISAFLSVFFK